MCSTTQGFTSIRLPCNYSTGLVWTMPSLLQQHRCCTTGGWNAEDVGSTSKDATCSDATGKVFFCAIVCGIVLSKWEQNCMWSYPQVMTKRKSPREPLNTKLEQCILFHSDQMSDGMFTACGLSEQSPNPMIWYRISFHDNWFVCCSLLTYTLWSISSPEITFGCSRISSYNQLSINRCCEWCCCSWFGYSGGDYGNTLRCGTKCGYFYSSCW